MKTNPYIYLLKKMWHYAPDKKLVVWMFLFSVISKLLRLLEPRVLGNIINMIQLEWFAAWWKIVRWLVWLGSITVFFWIFHGTSRVWEEKIKFDVAARFNVDMFHKIGSLPMQWHTDNHSGKTIDKVNKAMHALRNFSGNNFMYLDTIVLFIGSLISLTLIWWKAGILIAIISTLTLWIVWRFDLVLIEMIKKMNKREHVVMSTLFDLLSNIKTVITLRFEHRALTAVREKIQHVWPITDSCRKINEWKWFSMHMMMTIVMVVIFGWYIYEQFTVTGTVLIGTFTMLFQYVQKMKSGFQNFTWQYSDVVRKKTDMLTVVDIEQAYEDLWAWYATKLGQWWQVAISWLYFKYEDMEHEKHTLNNIDLQLHPGKKIALVGESGSGKSTLLSLLRWLYDVDTVKVAVDKKDYDSLHVLAQSTSLIPQEPEIFEETIRYNLTMGIDIDDEMIWQYLKLASAHEIVESLPNSLETDIKEKWVNLSWGQKQRLALTRGLLMSRESDIILLDEPTSSVDSMNEVLIHERIFDHFKNTCIISSIHKLHLLPFFDYIYVLQDGEIVEEWEYEHLSEKWGKLTELLEQYKVA